MTCSIYPAQLKNPYVFFATGFGAGCAPVAPGTVGTIVAIPFVFFMQKLSLELFIVLTLVVCVLGVWVCDVAATKLNTHDHPGIVLDEVAGYFVTMIAAPPGWIWIAVGFVLFRLFDILKPWPISWLDKKVSGGLGIMIDDIIAGIFSLLVLQLCVHYI